MTDLSREGMQTQIRAIDPDARFVEHARSGVLQSVVIESHFGTVSGSTREQAVRNLRRAKRLTVQPVSSSFGFAGMGEGAGL